MYAYSFANIILSVNGVPIDNYAEGDDDITVEPLADAATTKVGADGHMVASISANRGIRVTIKLQQTSPGNRTMQSLYNAQVVARAQFVPLSMSIKDALLQDAVTAIGGIITKQSTWKRGANANDTEWTLEFEKGTIDAGLATQLATSLPSVVSAAQSLGGMFGGII
jgi:Protein of unknown function (DUF3277)